MNFIKAGEDRMNQYAVDFLKGLRGKRIAVCGIGRNNLPVVHQLMRYGAEVFACDRRQAADLGDAYAELTNAGVHWHLGDDYLAHLDGMDMVLRTPGMKPYLPEFEAARARGTVVTSEMELFLSLCPAKVFAVTGSDGKTTTTTIIAGLLKAGGKKVWLGGNIGNPLLPVVEQVEPDDVAVIELSSFQLTMMKQSPSVGVVTNVAPNHLDWHTDMQEYIDAKKNLVLWQHGDGRAVLNADNAITAAFAADLPGQVVHFSRQGAVARGAWYDAADDGLKFTENGHTAEIMKSADILIPGVHNVENYLAAIAAVYGTVDAAVIREFARTFGGVPHRSELVRERHGVKWYNDSIGSSPSRTIAGLKAFDRKVILIAGGYDKHIPYTPLGPVAVDTVKHAILLGATAGAIEQAIKAAGDLPITHVGSMDEAVAVADRLASDGDIVFMSPASASFDMYKNFEERGNHFKQLVLALEG